MASSSSFRQPNSLRVLLRSEALVALRLLRWLPVWAVLLLFLVGMVAAYQAPHSYKIDVGSPQDEAYVRNFHARINDTEPSSRWSDVYGYIAFPGMGGARPFTATITLDTARTALVTIFINGEEMLKGTFEPGWRTLTLRIDSKHPQALQSRDTVIELRSTDYRTPEAPTEPKGVKVASVQVEQDSQGGFIAPALAPLVWLLLFLVMLYLLVGRALFGFATEQRARLWALLVMVIAAVCLIVAFIGSHIGVAVASEHIAVTAVSALLIAVVAELALLSRTKFMAALQCRVLALACALAFLLRFGGMALPQAVIIDMPYHIKWLRTLLLGDWQSLYFPGGLSAVPPEWGLNLLIPKSPLFYFAFAPLSSLPFELATSVKWIISLLDSSLVLAVFWLTRRAYPAIWAAIAAGALYSIMPLVFRAFAYGILPTIFAQWLATLLLMAVVAIGTRRWNVVQWIGMVSLATLVLLSFPTVALFVTLVVLGYMGALLLWRKPVGKVALSWQLGVMLVVAWLLAVWAYYGLYIEPVTASASALLAPKAGQSATVRWPGGFAELVAATASYVVTLLPVLLAALGFLLLFTRAKVSPERRRALLLLMLWAGVAPLFMLANYKVDMIGKHLFFTMAPFAVAGGVALFGLWRRGRWSTALAATALVLVGWQGLVFWVERLVRASI